MLNLIGFGIVMGLAFAAPPGAVTAETIRRGMARGFSAALRVQLGSLVGDATYALLALAGMAALVQNPVAQRTLSILAAVLLIYLAASGIRSAMGATLPSDSVAAEQRGAFLTGMMISLTNPWAIGFWLALGGALVSFGATGSESQMAIFFVSFFGVCLLYAFVMAFAAGWAHRALPPRAGRALAVLCSAAVGVFGLGLGYQVVLGFAGN